MTHLSIVVELQQSLDELRRGEEQLNGIPDWMEELHAQYSERKEAIDALEASAEQAAADRRAAEAEATDLQEKLKNYQEQISRVRNQREYGALLQEIDLVKQQIAQAEEAGFAALESQEAAQKELESQREDFSELDNKYKTELSKWEKEKPALAKRVEAVRSEVASLEQKLPPNVLAFFHRILDKHQGNALAQVQETPRAGKGPQLWHCGACNYRVRPQAVVDIANNGNLATCDSCKRILYLAES